MFFITDSVHKLILFLYINSNCSMMHNKYLFNFCVHLLLSNTFIEKLILKCVLFAKRSKSSNKTDLYQKLLHEVVSVFAFGRSEF